MGIAKLLKENYEKEKARLSGEARSEARMILNAKDIPQISGKLEGTGPAKPIPGVGIRMLDGKPMIFHTDGSLRHAMGRRLMKAERKALKKARREATKKSA